MNCNDGTQRVPYLRLDLNIWSIDDLPSFSSGPVNLPAVDQYRMIKDAGFEGIQDGDVHLAVQAGLRLTGQHRMNQVGDLDEKIREWTSEPYDCATIHVGWGIESELEADRLIGYALEISSKNNFPIYIETHRATLTQDLWRTVELVKRFPEIRFNGDFSHWYTGLEMVNGDFEAKLDFIAPVLERVRFIHGRIGNPGSIQVTVHPEEDEPFVAHFREMWTRSFMGFIKAAQPGDYLCFTPELLPSTYYYAQKVRDKEGRLTEADDRWSQALYYQKIARTCWNEALNRLV